MSSTRLFRCSAAASERGDPAIGSAPQVARWLLVEYRAGWKSDALAGSRIDLAIQNSLGTAAARQGARILFIRRPGREKSERARAWAVAQPGTATVWGTWPHQRDLLAAVEALDQIPSAPTTEVADPLILVCAHGIHDLCCATRGRPVAEALAAQWPAETWECSHVGGDRFAANVVVLPDGFYYGQLDPASAVDTVRDHLDGRVPVPRLRGMARFPPPVQAAVAGVHERWGPLAANDVELHGVERVSPGRWNVQLGVLDGRHARVQVTVVSHRQEPAQLTCNAVRATPATVFRVLEISTTSGH